MVRAFAERGADVIIASRKLDNCEKVADEVRALGRKALAVSAHVGKWPDCDRLIEEAYAAFGRVDILVNNAGMSPRMPSHEVTEQLFDSVALATGYREPGGRTAQRDRFLAQFAPRGHAAEPETSITQALALMNGRFVNLVTSAEGSPTLVAVCDTNAERAKEIAAEYGCEAFTDYRELIGRVDAVSVVVPTVDHATVACELLGAGIACLVEKPIAPSIEEADRIVASAATSGAVLQIGHIERFNPAVVAARSVLSKPRFMECHRLAAFTPRSLDIDVVMDLMIHDIDVILSLVKAEVIEINAAGIGILTPRVDIANARIEFSDGCIANVTASRVSAERVRKLRFFQPNNYVSIDYAEKEVNVLSLLPPQPGDERPRISNEMLPIDDVEPLRAELTSFLEAVRGEHPPAVTGADGRRALDVAVQVLDSIREHARKAGVDYGIAPR